MIRRLTDVQPKFQIWKEAGSLLDRVFKQCGLKEGSNFNVQLNYDRNMALMEGSRSYCVTAFSKNVDSDKKKVL